MISRIKVSKGQIKDQIFEDYLGLPPTDGHILSSDSLGNRTWIDSNSVGSVNNITEIPNRSYNDLQDLPTIPDPTSISIQDNSGSEQFIVSDLIQFSGLDFDAANKKIINNPLESNTIFLDFTNGDDVTGQRFIRTKPFKTLAAAYAQLPLNEEPWVIEILDGLGSNDMSAPWPEQNLTIKSSSNKIFDFTGCTKKTTGSKYFEIDMPLATIITDGGQWGIIDSGGAGNSGKAIFKFKCNIHEVNGASTTFYCPNTSDLSGDSYYETSETRINAQTVSSLTNFKGYVHIKKLTLNAEMRLMVSGDCKRLELEHIDKTNWTGNWNFVTGDDFAQETIIRKITGVATGVMNIGLNGANTHAKFNFSDTIIEGDIVINLGGGAGITEFSGSVTSPNYLNWYGSTNNNYADAELRLTNFKGKIAPGNSGQARKLYIKNSQINFSGVLHYHYAFGAQTPLRETVFEGANVIIADGDDTQMFTGYSSGLVTVRGPLSTNFKSFGINIDSEYPTVTFKEKTYEVVIRSKIDLVNKTLDSNLNYIIDGDISLDDGEAVIVPPGGLSISGYSFDASRLGSYGVANHSIFKSGLSGQLVDLVTGSLMGSLASVYYDDIGKVGNRSLYIKGVTESQVDTGIPFETVSPISGNSFSVGVWFQVDPTSPASGYRHIIGQGRYPNNFATFSIYIDGTNNTCNVGMRKASTVVSGTLTAGWHYCEVSYDDATNTAFANFDGTITPVTVGTAGVNATNGGLYITMGRTFIANSDYTFKGWIDNAFIFTRKRTETETQDTYNSGAGRTFTVEQKDSLAYFWSMEIDSTTKAIGGSGNLIIHNMAYTATGDNASVFDIIDVDGNNAIELNVVNFEGCTSLGTLNGYRQFTGTTCGIYGCSDGFTLSGTWNGFKLINSNAFGFGSTGTLFKAGAGLNFNNRFYLDVNVDLPSGAVFCDFASANFNDNELFQITNALVKYNSVIDVSNTSVLIPNIGPNDTKSRWTNNIGIENTATDYTDYSSPNNTIYRLSVDDDGTLSLGGTVFGENIPPIENINTPYTDLAAMYADQANQTTGFAQRVTGDSLLYYYLGTTTGDETDYLTFGGGTDRSESSIYWDAANDDNIFTVTDSASVSDVFVNGKRLGKGDEWTITDETNITIVNQLFDGDNIRIISGAPLSSGEVKSVSTNGGTSSYPDANGNIDLDVAKKRQKEVLVQDKSQLLGTLLSDVVYVLDGTFTLLAGESVEIPAGGLTLTGYGFDVSALSKDVVGEKIFTSPVGGSGNFITGMIQFNSGQGEVFDLTDSDGNHAIELNDVNFIGCASLGRLNGYRQLTGSTCGIYGCSDGIQISGSWSGFKLVNTNCFGFGATGTLFKKDTDTTFSNRMYLEINVDLQAGAVLSDFDETNFAEDELFQINSTIAKVNGVIDDVNAVTLIPNIEANNPKSLWRSNSGLPDTAGEKMVNDENVSGTYEIDWLKDTYILTMTGDTVFSEKNMPANLKNTGELKIYLQGDFIPTFVSDWLVNKVGTYKKGEVNEITLKFLKTGMYYMKIDNTLTVYPAPILGTVEPPGVYPEATVPIRLNGSFFTPQSIVEIEGQTINSKDFDSDTGSFDLNVTTGVEEGDFDIEISNGTNVVFSDRLTVVLGTVYILDGSYFPALPTANVEQREPGQLNSRQAGVNEYITGFTIPANTDFRITYSYLNPATGYHSGMKRTAGVTFTRVSDSVMLWRTNGQYAGNTICLQDSATGFGGASGPYINLSPFTSATVTKSNLMILERIDGVMTMRQKGNGGGVKTSAIIDQSEVRVDYRIVETDFGDLKYIELA
jgi:hypothetical protein